MQRGAAVQQEKIFKSPINDDKQSELEPRIKLIQELADAYDKSKKLELAKTIVVQVQKLPGFHEKLYGRLQEPIMKLIEEDQDQFVIFINHIISQTADGKGDQFGLCATFYCMFAYVALEEEKIPIDERIARCNRVLTLTEPIQINSIIESEKMHIGSFMLSLAKTLYKLKIANDLADKLVVRAFELKNKNSLILDDSRFLKAVLDVYPDDVDVETLLDFAEDPSTIKYLLLLDILSKTQLQKKENVMLEFAPKYARLILDTARQFAHTDDSPKADSKKEKSSIVEEAEQIAGLLEATCPKSKLLSETKQQLINNFNSVVTTILHPDRSYTFFQECKVDLSKCHLSAEARAALAKGNSQQFIPEAIKTELALETLKANDPDLQIVSRKVLLHCLQHIPKLIDNDHKEYLLKIATLAMRHFRNYYPKLMTPKEILDKRRLLVEVLQSQFTAGRLTQAQRESLYFSLKNLAKQSLYPTKPLMEEAVANILLLETNIKKIIEQFAVKYQQQFGRLMLDKEQHYLREALSLVIAKNYGLVKSDDTLAEQFINELLQLCIDKPKLSVRAEQGEKKSIVNLLQFFERQIFLVRISHQDLEMCAKKIYGNNKVSTMQVSLS